MNNVNYFNFLVNKESKEVKIEKSFNAPLGLVWEAWTKPEILDQWWGPKPWRAETQSMNFKIDGHWHYAMISPDNEKHFASFNYKSISPQIAFSGIEYFCDDSGNPNNNLPSMIWNIVFSIQEGLTLVTVLISFESLSDMEQIIEMGFKEGFTLGLNQLEEILHTNTW